MNDSCVCHKQGKQRLRRQKVGSKRHRYLSAPGFWLSSFKIVFG